MPLTEDVAVRRKVSRRADAAQARVADILEIAARSFGVSGYNGTSLREVAAAVGLSPAGLLHHFPDKRALLEAVLDERLGDIAERFDLNTTDGEVFLRGLIAAAEQDEQDPADLRLFTTLSAEAVQADHPAHGYFVQWHAEIRRHLEAALADLDARGLFHAPVSTADAALQIAALRDGLNQHWLAEPGALPFANTLRSAFRVYIDLEL